VGATGAARAQGRDADAEIVSGFFSTLAEAEERFFRFLETIDLLDAQAEIDRLVGSPWELSDSTTYKLSLLPFHIRYPIYRQIVQQMTRQDERRSRPIHSVTPDSVNLIALNLDSLADQNVKQEVRSALLSHFSVREILDLSFFILAQQSFFPETEDGWRDLERRIAHAGVAVGAGALAFGSAFDLFSLSRTGNIVRSSDRSVKLGWFGGVRRLGFGFRPILRGGLTLGLPGLELAAVITERIRPGENDLRRAVDLAVREGWLNRLTRAKGWDAFIEGAVRRTLAREKGYMGDPLTARAGFFFKREEIPGFPNLSLRGSTELDFHFEEHTAYFTVGLGFEHARSGLSAVLQMSRTPEIRNNIIDPDTRGGVFLAGTMDPPLQMFIERMRARAHMVEDEWDAMAEAEQRQARHERTLRSLGTSHLPLSAARAALNEVDVALADRELHAGLLADRLAEYLESRKVAYSLSRWSRTKGDLHGPLDPSILGPAREQVFSRLDELSHDLEATPPRLRLLHQRYFTVVETLRDAEEQDPSQPALARYKQQAAALEKVLRRESERASVRVAAYLHYRDNARRILADTSRPAPRRNPDPLKPEVLRRVIALQSLPLR
jgi:hypothetical protein